MTSLSQSYHQRTPPRNMNGSGVGSYRTPSRDAGYSAQIPENLSGTKSNLDSQVSDIKTILDNKYNGEINLWRVRLQEAEARRLLVEQDNQRMLQEIQFYKGKSSAGEVDKLSKVLAQDQVRSNQMEQIRSTGESQSLNLRLEAERLRNLLNSKVEECNQIKANFSKLEVLDAENREKNEAAQDYQGRIQRLKEDYSQRLLEVEDLKKQRNRLEVDNLTLEKAQREADNLKQLLESKREENSRIRKEKTEIEVENYKAKKNEVNLLLNEVQLKNQIQSLEGAAAATEDLRKSQYFEKSQAHTQAQDELRKSFHAEVAGIENEIGLRQQIASNKIAEIDNLRRSYHDFNTELAREDDNSKLADAESRVWKEKTAEAERIKEAEIQRASRLRDAQISATTTDNLREKVQLEERVDTLHKVIGYKEQDLGKVQRDVELTEAEKRLLQDERLKLQSQIDDLLRKQDDNEKRFQASLRARDDLHSHSVERMRKDHDNEKRRMNNQISALRNVIDIKRDEADRARSEANGHVLNLVRCDSKSRVAEGETQFWRNQTDRVARQKDLEYNVERSLANQQLRELDRSQSIEKLQKLRESDAIRGVINVKEREALELRNSQARTAADIAQERYLKSRMQSEADINRSRALVAESSKYQELLVKDVIHNVNVDSLRRSGQIESNVLRTEVNHLSGALIRKDREARDWKDNYTRVATSPYRKY